MFHWTIHVKGEHRNKQAAVVVGHKLYCFGHKLSCFCHKLYCFGHKLSCFRNPEKRDHIEVEVFNTVSLCWRRLTPVTPGRGERNLVPSRRYGHTAALIGDTVYIWGGSPFCNELYAFDVDTHGWFKPEVSGTVPEEREYHSACVLGKVMFIHGGWTQNFRIMTNDICKLDTTTMVWTLINTRGPPPPSTQLHSATIIGTKMFVFGCLRNSWGQGCNTIRVFDTETNCWLNTPSAWNPPERSFGHSAFTYNGELYIYGGFKWNLNQNSNDLWKFSPETFSWKTVQPKGKRPGPTSSMCCCMVGDRVFLFGGDDTPYDLNVLDFSPSLKTLCKLTVIQYDLEQSELPHNIRWELRAGNVLNYFTPLQRGLV